MLALKFDMTSLFCRTEKVFIIFYYGAGELFFGHIDNRLLIIRYGASVYNIFYFPNIYNLHLVLQINFLWYPFIMDQEL